MYPQYQSPTDHLSPLEALEIKKQQARAILDSLDDNAMMSLARKFHERGLVNIPQLVTAAQTQYGAPFVSSMTTPAGMDASMANQMAFAHLQMGASHPQLGATTVGSGHLYEALPVGALPPGPVHPNSFPPPGPPTFVGLPPGPVSPHAAFTPNGFALTHPATSHGQFPSVSHMVDGIPPPPPQVPPSLPPGNWVVESSPPSGTHLLGDESFESQAVESEEMGNSSEQVVRDLGYTTLILRNFPPSFDQEKAEKWVDSVGYEGLYDFLLWFPAKSTSRINSCGYAFVNFRREVDARRFVSEQHQARFPVEANTESNDSLPLSVAVAKVQGFAANYARFNHLTDDKAATRCQPFFARDAVLALNNDEIRAAADASATMTHSKVEHVEISGPVTTIVIRNLPSAIESSDTARRWLDIAGYTQKYDFVLFLPAKRSARLKPVKNPAAPLHNHGYAFVNFKQCSDAMACMEKLHGMSVGESEVALNVVAAKVQGHTDCVNHFSSLVDGGRCTAWIESAVEPHAPIVPQRASFQ